MKRIIIGMLCLCFYTGVGQAKKGPAGELTTFNFADEERSYFIYAPADLPESPALLVLLHGSGQNGDSLVGPWKKLADKERIVLVAPNSADSSMWSPYTENPEFIKTMLKHVAETHTFDSQNTLLFGHSGGAVWGLQLGLLASDVFAAVAVHAGLIPPPDFILIDQAKNKIPFQIQVGTRDPYFPVPEVQKTVDRLHSGGFQATLVTISGHDHNYYAKSKKINQTAWEFLSAHTQATVE